MTRTLRWWLPWLPFALWSLLIFALIPQAAQLQRAATERFGDATFRWLVATLLGAVAMAAASWVIWRKPTQALERLGWVVGIVGIAVIWVWQLRGKAEALHWVEYGVLGVLAFHALRSRLPDTGVYPVAVALTALIGTVDEILQWLMPGRFFDLADIVLNASIGCLTQLLIARGWRPEGLTSAPSLRSSAWFLRLLIAEVLLLLFCVSSTPVRVSGWAQHASSLAYLGDEASTRMIEYGYRYEGSEAGIFRSRLSPDELAQADAQRNVQVAALLDRHTATRFSDFTTLFSPRRDPFAFEIRSHLFFRDRHRLKARSATADGERRRHLTLVLGEQLILERYFGRTLRLSNHDLKPEERAELALQAKPNPGFESEADRALITAFSEAQAQGALVFVLLGLAVFERVLIRRHSRLSS